MPLCAQLLTRLSVRGGQGLARLSGCKDEEDTVPAQVSGRHGRSLRGATTVPGARMEVIEQEPGPPGGRTDRMGGGQDHTSQEPDLGVEG